MLKHYELERTSVNLEHWRPITGRGKRTQRAERSRIGKAA